MDTCAESRLIGGDRTQIAFKPCVSEARRRLAAPSRPGGHRLSGARRIFLRRHLIRLQSAPDAVLLLRDLGLFSTQLTAVLSAEGPSAHFSCSGVEADPDDDFDFWSQQALDFWVVSF